MLLKQLSRDDKRTFLQLAELLSLSDKPVQRGGNASTTILRSEHNVEAMDDIAAILAHKNASIFDYLIDAIRTEIETEFVKRVAALQAPSGDNPIERVKIASEMLREILKGKTAATPSVPKLMLFELFMLVLKAESISSVQWQLLTEVKHHYQLENRIFDDLLERAKCTHQETQKTVAIILE